MLDYYDQLSAAGNNDSVWHFDSWTPDVVAINLFQNDSWLIERDKRMSPAPSDAQIIEAYKAFVQKIRTHYPSAQIICALGSMDAVRPGST